MNTQPLNNLSQGFGLLSDLLEKREAAASLHRDDFGNQHISGAINAFTKKISEARNNLATAIARLPETEKEQALLRSREWLDEKEHHWLVLWVNHRIKYKPRR